MEDQPLLFQTRLSVQVWLGTSDVVCAKGAFQTAITDQDEIPSALHLGSSQFEAHNDLLHFCVTEHIQIELKAKSYLALVRKCARWW